MITRRGFLSLLAPAAALIAAPELLLPKRTFFLPPVGGWSKSGAVGWVARSNNLPLTATEVLMRQQYMLNAALRAAFPPLVVNGFVADLTTFGRAHFEVGHIHYASFPPLKPLES